MGGKTSRGERVLSGGKSKGKHKGPGRPVHRMSIRRAANGGFIAEHQFRAGAKEPMAPEPEEHQIGDLEQLQQHVGEHMGEPDGDEPPPPTVGMAPGLAGGV